MGWSDFCIPAFLLRRRLSLAIVLARVGALHLPKQHEGLQMIRPQRRAEVIDALRRGTVPKAGLDALAVGYGRLQRTLDEELAAVASGRGAFKAIRGEYGSGKTFFGRWLQERARARGLATSEVQISETETPLHRLETVYRRLVERIATADSGEGAFRGIVDVGLVRVYCPLRIAKVILSQPASMMNLASASGTAASINLGRTGSPLTAHSDWGP